MRAVRRMYASGARVQQRSAATLGRAGLCCAPRAALLSRLAREPRVAVLGLTSGQLLAYAAYLYVQKAGSEVQPEQRTQTL